MILIENDFKERARAQMQLQSKARPGQDGLTESQGFARRRTSGDAAFIRSAECRVSLAAGIELSFTKGIIGMKTHRMARWIFPLAVAALMPFPGGPAHATVYYTRDISGYFPGSCGNNQCASVGDFSLRWISDTALSSVDPAGAGCGFGSCAMAKNQGTDYLVYAMDYTISGITYYSNGILDTLSYNGFNSGQAFTDSTFSIVRQHVQHRATARSASCQPITMRLSSMRRSLSRHRPG